MLSTETAVVTFGPVAGPGSLDGLRRMTLAEAQRTAALALRIPKHGRIVDAATLETIERF